MNAYTRVLRDVQANYRASSKFALTVGSGSPLQIYFLKPVSLYLTPIFVWLRMSPNQVTWIGFVIGLTACVMLAVGLSPFVMIGAWLYLLHRVFDHLDGNLARYSQRTSYYGHFLDASLDVVIQMALFVSVGIGTYRQVQAGTTLGYELLSTGPEYVLLAGALASLFWQLSRYTKLDYKWTLAEAGLANEASGLTASAVKRSLPAQARAAEDGLWGKANLARRSIVPLVRVPGLLVAAHTNTLLAYLGFFALYFPLAFVMQYARLLKVSRNSLRTGSQQP